MTWSDKQTFAATIVIENTTRILNFLDEKKNYSKFWFKDKLFDWKVLEKARIVGTRRAEVNRLTDGTFGPVETQFEAETMVE